MYPYLAVSAGLDLVVLVVRVDKVSSGVEREVASLDPLYRQQTVEVAALFRQGLHTLTLVSAQFSVPLEVSGVL